ncbi:unnamed protein product [Orchesella dallaii]|uniref:Uncharacterized protein n=1 Tax=Orchesella dallaii TaxID=48710 RepID=A0ABP1S143_9HEXA
MHTEKHSNNHMEQPSISQFFLCYTYFTLKQDHIFFVPHLCTYLSIINGAVFVLTKGFSLFLAKSDKVFSMGSTCESLTIPKWVELIALTSITLGAVVTAVSSWVLNGAIQNMRNPAFHRATAVFSQLNQLMGGITDIDLEHLYKVVIISSAITLAGGLAQFIVSGWLLRETSRGGESPAAKFWILSHLFVLAAMGGGFICIVTLEVELNTRLRVFLGVTGIDFILLIYFLWFVYEYTRKRQSSGVLNEPEML